MKTGNRKKYIRLAVYTLFILIAGIGAYAFSVYYSLSSAVNDMHKPVDRKSEHRAQAISLADQEPFSVLLLGVDERENDSGRSDTMIVLSVNPSDQSIKMLSIPRDTRTDIIGHGTVEKINHAFAYGGAEMALDTVEHFLKVPIDYYVKINMEGFKGIIDAVGGVTVDNDMNLFHGSHTFQEGEITLSGDEALVFSRIRYEDPRGDFGRQLRQKLILEAIVEEGASISSLWNYDGIFKALGTAVETNLTFQEMVDIQSSYRNVRNIDQLQFQKGDGGYVGDLWYYFPDESELSGFTEEFRTHLELE
ncbi:LCP family protein [Mesobacillus harenae]|uniref:LCP family glycopolymer transferase n=1 Tax=Mesobacillus harenae TaxID=2213203 RepID=UPI001F55644A|nr:LCP family protein [Mesobacillus harenae]